MVDKTCGLFWDTNYNPYQAHYQKSFWIYISIGNLLSVHYFTKNENEKNEKGLSFVKRSKIQYETNSKWESAATMDALP